MNSQAVLEILITIAKQSQEAISRLKTLVDGVGSSVSGLNNQDTGGLEDNLNKVGEAAKTAGDHGAAAGQKLGDGLHNAGGHADALAVKMLHLIHTVELAAKGFLALETVRFIREVADETAASEALAFGLKEVGLNAGYTADQMKEATEAVMKFGITDDVAAKSLSRLVSKGVSPEAAADLAKAARELAIGTNQAVDTTMEELSRASDPRLVRMLQRKYGLILNTGEEIRKAYLKKLKETGSGDLTQREMAAVTTATVTKAIHEQRGGDSADADQLTAAKLNDLRAAWANFKSGAGEGLQSIFGAIYDAIRMVVEGLGDFIKGITGSGDKAKESGDNFSILADAIRGIGTAIKWILDFLADYGPMMEHVAVVTLLAANVIKLLSGEVMVFTGRAAFMLGPIGWVIGAFLLLDSMGVDLKKVFETLGATLVVIGSSFEILGLRAYKAWLEVENFFTHDPKKKDELIQQIKDVDKALADSAAAAKQARKDAQDIVASGLMKKDTPGAEKPGDPRSGSGVDDTDDLAKSAREKAKIAGEVAMELRQTQASREYEIAKASVDWEKEILSQKEKDLKAHYDLGLVEFADYYDQQEKIIRQKGDQDLKQIEAEQLKSKKQAAAELAKLGVDYANREVGATGKGDTTGEKLQLQMQQVRDKEALADQQFEDKKKLKRLQTADEVANKEIEKTKAIRDAGLAVLDQQIALEKAKHNDYLGDVLDADKAYIDAVNKAEGSADKEQLIAQAEKIHKIALVNAEAKEQDRLQKLITSELDYQNKLLDDRISKLTTAHNNGAVSDFDFELRKNALLEAQIGNIQKQIDLKQAMYDKDKAAFDSGADGHKDEQTIADEKTALQALQAQVVSLEGQFTHLSDTIQKKFGDEVYSVFDKLISRTMTFGQAVRAAVADFAKFVAQTEAKEISQKITISLANATGGKDGSGGIFGELARLMQGGKGAEKGTESNPMIVAAKKGSTLESLLGAGSGKSKGNTVEGMLADQGGKDFAPNALDKVAEGEPAQGFFDGLLSKFTGLFTSVGATVKDIFNGVSGFISSLFSGGGSGGGSGVGSLVSGFLGGGGSGSPSTGGGQNWLGEIASIFGYADGGHVPGVGDGDTVPAMLTPGEFVITKDKTQKYRPLLEAMLSGKLEHSHGLKVPGVAKFAKGGLVGGTGVPGPTSTTGAPQVNHATKIINVIDPSLVAGFLSTSEGERAILNVIERNPNSIKQAVS